MVKHQSRFSRTIANEGKMGAYYTDIEHCRCIARMFEFPDEEVCAIDPSIGNGHAVITCTGAEQNPNIKIFGVELNDEVAEDVKRNSYIEDVLKADFLTDVFITNNVFSFCFGNPPYLNANDDDRPGGRTERVFLEKVGNYLMAGAVLVWVIPFYIYQEDSYIRYFNSRYELLGLYRFRGREYEKYHQIVLIGRKRKLSKMLSKSEMESFLSQVESEDMVQELPENFDEKIPVLPSPLAAVTTFAKREFDVEAAYSAIQKLPDELLREFNERVTLESYAVCNIGRPPIPLKKDSLYLLATSGGGQGLTGSEETKDLHLQRGVAEVIEEPLIETKGTGMNKRREVTIRTRTSVSMTVVQNNGRIDKLV